MRSTATLFYDLPDITRSLDILLGVLLSGLLTYFWTKRTLVKNMVNKKNRIFVFFGTLQISYIFLYIVGGNSSHLLLMQIASIGILFQSDTVWDMIFKKFMVKRV